MYARVKGIVYKVHPGDWARVRLEASQDKEHPGYLRHLQIQALHHGDILESLLRHLITVAAMQKKVLLFVLCLYYAKIS